MNLARLALVSSLALFLGCADECDANSEPSRCEGNAAVYCQPAGVDQLIGGATMKHQDCGADTCVQVEGGAFCALSADPAPACAGGMSSACEDARTKVYCAEGYATSRTACSSCVQDGNVATCNGGVSSPCQSSQDCMPGLSCSKVGYCGK